MNKVPDLVFHHHTSLGDNFICNGIVHTYAEQLCDRLHIPIHRKYQETIECLYQDFDNIIIEHLMMTGQLLSERCFLGHKIKGDLLPVLDLRRLSIVN